MNPTFQPGQTVRFKSPYRNALGKNYQGAYKVNRCTENTKPFKKATHWVTLQDGPVYDDQPVGVNADLLALIPNHKLESLFKILNDGFNPIRPEFTKHLWPYHIDPKLIATNLGPILKGFQHDGNGTEYVIGDSTDRVAIHLCHGPRNEYVVTLRTQENGPVQHAWILQPDRLDKLARIAQTSRIPNPTGAS